MAPLNDKFQKVIQSMEALRPDNLPGSLHFPSKLKLPENPEISKGIATPSEGPDSYVHDPEVLEHHNIPAPPAVSGNCADRQSVKPNLLTRLSVLGFSALTFFGAILGAVPSASAQPALNTATESSQVLKETGDKGVTEAKDKAGAGKTDTSGEIEAKESVQKNVNPSRAETHALLKTAAKKHKVPEDVIFAVAWQESNWKQFEDDGSVVRGENRGKKGRLLSTDWGIMQINDKHHPTAFPKAKEDIAYNINYAAGLLRSLYRENGNWHLALTAYNGDDSYAHTIERLMKRKPWPKVRVQKQKVTTKAKVQPEKIKGAQ